MKLFGKLFKKKEREYIGHPDLDHFHEIFAPSPHRVEGFQMEHPSDGEALDEFYSNIPEDECIHEEI